MRFWRWMAGLKAGLCILITTVTGAQAVEWTLDAADGADLAARLRQVDYAAEDTLWLSGRFASAETVFPLEVYVLLKEDDAVYGDLIFAQGGGLTGNGMERTQACGNVRSEKAGILLLKNVGVAGSVWVGEPSDEASPSGGWLRIEGEVTVTNSDYEGIAMFSTGDVSVEPGADLRVFACGNMANAVWALGSVAVERNAEVLAWASCDESMAIDAGESLMLAASAYVLAISGLDRHGVRAQERIDLHEGAMLAGLGGGAKESGDSVKDIWTGTLAAAPNSVLETRTLGISVSALSIDPAATFNATTLLLRGGAPLPPDLTFLYDLLPPVIWTENGDGDTAIVPPEQYRPVKKEDP